MRRNFKKFLSGFMACALTLSLAPSAGAATVNVPAGGTAEGNSDIIYENTEIYSVVVPTTLDITIDPQGLANFKDPGTSAYDPAEAGKVLSSWTGIMNKSSKPMTVSMEAYVDMTDYADNADADLQLVTSTDLATIEADLTDASAALALEVVPATAKPTVTASGSSIIVDDSTTASTAVAVPVTGAAISDSSKFGFQLDAATYKYVKAGDAGYDADLDTDGNGVMYIYDTAANDGDVVAFKFDGGANTHGDWSAFTTNGISIAVKYHFGKLGAIDTTGTGDEVVPYAGDGYHMIEYVEGGSDPVGGNVLTSDGTGPIVYYYDKTIPVTGLIIRPESIVGSNKADINITASKGTYWDVDTVNGIITIKPVFTNMLHSSATRGAGTYSIRAGAGSITQNFTIE